VLFLELGKLALLFPPLGTSLALRTLVWLWEQLLNRYDGNRLGGGNDVVSIPLSSYSSPSAASWSDGLIKITFVPLTSIPVLALGSLLRTCAGAADILEGSRYRGDRRHKPAFCCAQRIDLIPQLVTLTKGLDLELL
jgi:hypothetical protein